MKVAFGFKPHSGWAALVVLGRERDELVVVDRRRVEFADESWAKQPYHAAEGLNPKEARLVVTRGIQSANRLASRELRAAAKRESIRKNEVVGCSVLVGAPMPNWNTDEILAVHFRMHKAEGVLFQNALVHAAEKCKLNPLRVLEKALFVEASTRLGVQSDVLVERIAGLGKTVGAPWGKDQKAAALGALMALHK